YISAQNNGQLQWTEQPFGILSLCRGIIWRAAPFFGETRGKGNQWISTANISGAVFFFLSQVFELGPSLHVVELRKSQGDTAVYRELCDRISSDLGIDKIFGMGSLFDENLPSFDSRAATPLVAL
uniref:Uncharacterized protein n=1 Tax=Aegilops tauschii subsp. strangulata TaxID=200361 RepID=A0A452XXL6_AEGTS